MASPPFYNYFLHSNYHLTADTILVLDFHNASQYPDLNWVGESISQTLIEEFAGKGEIALDRPLAWKVCAASLFAPARSSPKRL